MLWTFNSRYVAPGPKLGKIRTPKNPPRPTVLRAKNLGRPVTTPRGTDLTRVTHHSRWGHSNEGERQTPDHLCDWLCAH
ncbi:hypothetical protein LSAT2_006238 [Lamellibrachia satsuma]|nr:hypothetical protein LSAT2_006238 [Lamellibrachia satsuma]